MLQREVRPARSEDREAVLAFCTNTWEWGDYIERVWDDWLMNSAGQLIVATIDGQPVGMVHMSMLTRTDAWLEGMRIDPQYRQQGLARELNQAVMLEAMRRGATYARLTTEFTNTRSIQIVEQAHMRRVGGFAFFTAPSLDAASDRGYVQEQTQLATLADLDEIIDYLNASNVFPAVGGLYYVSFIGYPITAELLEAKIVAENVYLLRRWNRLDGLAIAELRGEMEERCLSIGYIDGTAIEAISLIAHHLRHRSYELGIEAVRAYVPDLVLLRDAFTGVGYEWDGSVFYTYERGLE